MSSDDLTSPAPTGYDPTLWRLVREFHRSLPDRLDEVEAAFAGHRWHELHMVAHRLKGVGASFGVPELTRAAGSFKDALSDAAARYGRARLADGSVHGEDWSRLRQLVDYPLPNPLLERLSLDEPYREGFTAFLLTPEIVRQFEDLRACLRALCGPEGGAGGD